MAEIEMEVDTAPQFGTESNMDDDLISYDSEAEKDPGSADCTMASNNPELTRNTAPQEGAQKHQHEDTEVDLGIYDDVDYFERDEKNEAAQVTIADGSINEEKEAGHEVSHEIDYEIQESTLHAAEAASGTVEAIAAAAAGEQHQHQHEELDTTKRQGEEEHENNEGDHELTWENEEEQTHDGAVEEKGRAAEDRSEQPQTSLSELSGVAGQAQVKPLDDNVSVAPEEPCLDDDIVHDGGMDYDGATQGNAEYDKHSDRSDREESHSANHGFPAVTVQYKGDEFPCFSLTSEGFFSHLSVLDDNMKSLLNGFRAELSNELLPDDELVFQVDELGLEFSESSSPDALLNITLKQILEIFDILIKNQDPNSTRTLYTYLFTRPSTSKRFDFLMESATEGKGLDEVIHLFQSTIRHTAHFAEAFVEDDLDTQLGEYDSAGDDYTTQDVGQESDVLATSEQVVEESSDDHAPPALSGAAEIQTNYLTEDQHYDNVVASGALAAEDDVGDGEEVEAEISAADSRQPWRGGDVNDITGSEANGLLGFDFDESADVISTNAASDVEAKDKQLSPEDANASLGATDASTTTTTMSDDGDATSTPAELDTIDDTANEITAEDAVDHDDLGDIDWRDDAETHHDDIDGETSSTAAKRTHDELDVADDQNVKRLRP
ncbi:hypothetical protein QQS21_012079 [Conoideocrella luteorostrata]|uniref:Uncharacterized protein n=1 Tax=Conoideocrella luteorostrata TaxID=1105319 RepID=A0AAJ0FT17_9HYPO|nr:hypothetical protein QQS21_012079 [Conoideocrella luteorostrata]